MHQNPCVSQLERQNPKGLGSLYKNIAIDTMQSLNSESIFVVLDTAIYKIFNKNDTKTMGLHETVDSLAATVSC